MRIVAFITQPRVIDRILTRLHRTRMTVSPQSNNIACEMRISITMP